MLKLLFFLFVLYSLFYLILANANFNIAAKTVQNIKSCVQNTVINHPKGTTFYFLNTPDNYKGCYIGFPVYEKPFYRGPYIIIGNHLDHFNKAKYYIWDKDHYVNVSYNYVVHYNIPALNMDNGKKKYMKILIDKIREYFLKVK